MNGVMTACAPTGASAQESRVRKFANEDFSTDGVNLGVTFQTKIVVALDEHLVVHRAVR